MIDAHIEPITGTPLRGKGTATDCKIPEEHSAGIVVLQDAYTIVNCQQSIYELAKLLLDSGYFQWIFVEGARGPVDATYARQFGATLEERVANAAQVSPGILALLDALPPAVQVWGIDDMVLRTEQHTVQRRCTRAMKRWRQLVSDFREALAEAKQATQYTEPMLWLSRNFFSEHDDLSLAEKVTGLFDIGTTVGLAGDFFPMLTKFSQVLSIEKSLDYAKVEKERSVFIRQLVNTLDDWWQRYEQHAVLDLSRALPPIRFWLKKTKQSESDLEREVATHGISAILRRCQEWLLRFLVDRSLQYRAGVVSHAEYYSDVLSLGLRLNVDIFRFAELMRYCSYVEEASAIASAPLLNELQDYVEEIMELLISTTVQREVYEVEKSLHLLSKAGRMAISADDVKGLDEEMTWPVLQERLRPFSHRAQNIQLPGRRRIDAMTRMAFQFSEVSAQREHIMTEEAVRQLSTHGGTGAILVGGGYHTAAVTGLLAARYQDIAWSVIRPSMRTEDVDKYLKNL